MGLRSCSVDDYLQYKGISQDLDRLFQPVKSHQFLTAGLDEHTKAGFEHRAINLINETSLSLVNDAMNLVPLA